MLRVALRSRDRFGGCLFGLWGERSGRGLKKLGRFSTLLVHVLGQVEQETLGIDTVVEEKGGHRNSLELGGNGLGHLKVETPFFQSGQLSDRDLYLLFQNADVVAVVEIVTDLAKAQVEFDLGCEDIIARHGRARAESTATPPGQSADFIVGQRSYETVVLPPHTENVDEFTADMLGRFVDGGGRVFCCGPPPTRVDGALNDSVQKPANSATWLRV